MDTRCDISPVGRGPLCQCPVCSSEVQRVYVYTQKSEDVHGGDTDWVKPSTSVNLRAVFEWTLMASVAAQLLMWLEFLALLSPDNVDTLATIWIANAPCGRDWR